MWPLHLPISVTTEMLNIFEENYDYDILHVPAPTHRSGTIDDDELSTQAHNDGNKWH